MASFYKRYAYADLIDLGDVKILQSRRDPQFELWIRQMGIDTSPRLQMAREMPINTKTTWWRPFYKFFHMETVTKIFRGNDEIILDRTHELNMTTNLNGRLKLADDDDILQRCEFVAGASPVEKKIILEVPKTPKKAKKAKVSLGNTQPISLPVEEPPPTIEEPKPVEPVPTTKQIQGAIIDESF